MIRIADELETTERIVIGALSITILIAVLVVSCVLYWIKKNSEIEDNKMKHDLGDHGIGTKSEREAITSWHAKKLYYDIVETKWFYNSDVGAPGSVTWREVQIPPDKKKN